MVSDIGKEPGTDAAERLTASFDRQTDIIQPFQIEGTQLRGRLVRLEGVLDTILSAHAYPPLVGELLAQSITASVALSALLKYDGIFTLQAKGDGPVPLLVTDITTDGGVRGYAKFNTDQVLELSEKLNADKTSGCGPAESGSSLDAEPGGPALADLMGKGYLAFTVDQGAHTDRYQGIVELQGTSITDCVRHYFRQSEQLETGLTVTVDQHDGRWRGGALIVQRIPGEGGAEAATVPDRSDSEDDWRRTMVLLSSLTAAEMVDPSLPPNDLLFRLFHEDGVRVFERHPVSQSCRCTREKIGRMLDAMPRETVIDIAEEGVIEVTCEFCSRKYVLQLSDIIKPDA